MDDFLNARRDSELEEKDIDKAKNVGFRVYDQGVVTYEQSKLRLSGYYDKRYVLADGIIQGRWIFKSTIKDVFL